MRIYYQYFSFPIVFNLCSLYVFCYNYFLYDSQKYATKIVQPKGRFKNLLNFKT